MWNSLQREMAPKRFARSYSNSDSDSDSHEVRKVRSLSIPSCETLQRLEVPGKLPTGTFLWTACLLCSNRSRRRPNRRSPSRRSKICRSCCRLSSNCSARPLRRRRLQLRPPLQPQRLQPRRPPLLQQPLLLQLRLRLLPRLLQLKWQAFKNSGISMLGGCMRCMSRASMLATGKGGWGVYYKEPQLWVNHTMQVGI